MLQISKSTGSALARHPHSAWPAWDHREGRRLAEALGGLMGQEGGLERRGNEWFESQFGQW